MPVTEADREAPIAERETTAVNAIRFLAADAVEKANSGHPGMPMGCAPMAYVLWSRFLKHNPDNPSWPDRDRFVLSAGHGSMLLYAMLHLTGYDLPMDQIRQFRQLGSETPGHPENFLTAGVETTTGPLGQGFANAVGMAIAERFLASHFNRPDFDVVNHYTYCICSDGDLMEGVSHEAASLAGHLGLGKLIFLYDDNGISIDGSTELAFTEDVRARFRAYGWQVLEVDDGTDLDAVDAALRAGREDTTRPTLIAVKTVIGFGSPNKQGTADVHGAPLGEQELILAKKNLGWPTDRTFHVPDDVYVHMDASAVGQAREDAWNGLLKRYKAAHPGLAQEFESWFSGKLESGWDADLPEFAAGSRMATRASSGKVLAAIAGRMPNLIGGSADLTGSNKTDIPGRPDMSRDNPGGSYLRFGVREHGMAGICNGMMLHGGLRPFCASFLVFTDYMRPSLRLSALMDLPVIYVMTHDSIGLGEDGPTHQPIEHYMALRAIPNLQFIRPADAGETMDAWRVAIETTDRPTVLSLTRQSVPTLDRTGVPSNVGVSRGGYVLDDSDDVPDVILIGTGSEVSVALDASRLLRDQGLGVRVVSMPSFELFERQSREYRDEVLPPAVTARVSVEAGTTFGWDRYVGRDGRSIGIDRFGASAPFESLYEKFGITAERVAAVAVELTTPVDEDA